MEQIKKYIKDNYIPKKVIRNKIKELEKTLQTDNISQYLETIAQTKALYELLQKDMEEDNYNHIPRID